MSFLNSFIDRFLRACTACFLAVFALVPQSACGTELQLVERIAAEKILPLYPPKARENVLANWPLIQTELKHFGLGESRELIIYALATIRVETSMFSPDPEKPSKFSTTIDRPGYAGIQTPGIERPFGSYDSTIRTRNDGSAIINKQLGNCLYTGKDEELMRARHGMPPKPECDDGIRFRGRGFIQLTGRYNYERMQQRIADKMTVDIVKSPDDAGKPDVAAKILAAFLAENRAELENHMKRNNYQAARKIVNQAGLGMETFLKSIHTGDKIISLMNKRGR